MAEDLPTAFVGHADCSRHDTGWNHPDHQGRLPGMVKAVHRDMLTLHGSLLEVEAAPADDEDLRMVHDAAYVDRIRERAAEADREGQPLAEGDDLVLSGASFQAAAAAAGAVLTGVETVLRGEAANAFCATRPPGHGAGRAGSDLYSVFNSVMVGAARLRRRRGLERVLVIEWAAAPGRGTAELAAGDEGLRLLSIHEAPTEPVDWPGNAVAEPLPTGAGGDAFAAALDRGLSRVLAGFSPEFVLLSLGFDALAADPLGALALEPRDYFGLTRRLVELAGHSCDGRLVSALEGGYEPRASGAALVQHLRALTGLQPA